MSDAPPDRIAGNPRSKYYNKEALARGVGIRFNGKQRHDVDEYCISEGWIRVAVGRARDRFGHPITMRLNGAVEAFFEDADTSDAEGDDQQEDEQGESAASNTDDSAQPTQST